MLFNKKWLAQLAAAEGGLKLKGNTQKAGPEIEKFYRLYEQYLAQESQNTWI